MTPAFIGIGSNLNSPALQLAQAVSALRKLPHSTLEQVSSAYQSKAVGPGEQPDYLNAVVQVNTTLSPLTLLDHLQSIEQAQGRQRGVRWGARTLDLDLLLYGDSVINEARLTLPHPRILERDFVLRPLLEIIGDSTLATTLATTMDFTTALKNCASNALVKIDCNLDNPLMDSPLTENKTSCHRPLSDA